VAVLIAVLMMPVLLAISSAYAPTAHALIRTGNLWTVTPGAAGEIQQAIDAARDNGGGRVRLPAGVYLLTSKVRLHNNVTVYGDGMDQTILRWAPGATTDHMMSNATLTAGNQNLQVWGLTLDGQNRPGCDDGCIGLRLNNVRNSTFVGVAADNFTHDGIYVGYNQNNGAHSVRLSGCRAANNFRNGIGLIHGDSNVIDGCQVHNNNRGEAVAGIDLEPDEGQSLTNNKIVGNTVTGQNAGIQLFEPHNNYATIDENAVCYNNVHGNNAGIYIFRGEGNYVVGNNSSGNGVDYSLDDETLVGDAYASRCTLAALPPHPSTINDTPPPSCSPRPTVTVTTQKGAPGTLNVTVTVTRQASAPYNTVRQIQFGPTRNASVTINGQTDPDGNFTATMPLPTTSVSFVVRRSPPPPAPAQASTVPFTVIDDCGGWDSFVGGGPTAF
jgi:hypothetical protein